MILSVFEVICQECADQTSAQHLLRYATILVAHFKDFRSEFDRALGPVAVVGGKSGICVTFMTSSADSKKPNVFPPFYEEVNITAIVQENFEQNNSQTGTQVSAYRVCQEIVAKLTAPFMPTHASSPLKAKSPTIVRGPDDEYLNYNVNLVCSARDARIITDPYLPAPTSPSPGVLACSQPGAAIFYTQDGSNPSPQNGTLYLASFTPSGPQNVRANAWLSGWLTSPTLNT